MSQRFDRIHVSGLACRVPKTPSARPYGLEAVSQESAHVPVDAHIRPLLEDPWPVSFGHLVGRASY